MDRGVLQCSAFFIVQLSDPFPTGKTTALTKRILVGKGVSLLLNMLSRLVITFIPRSKHLLISWLQSLSAVILEPPQKSLTAAAAAKSLQSCPTLCDPIDGSPPGSPALGFSRQEYWSGLPFPSPMYESEKPK